MAKRVLRVGLSVVVILLIIAGGLGYWYYHRPAPASVQRTLFEGVTYVRDVRREPRPLVIHVVTVDLDAAGIGFLVTPGDPTRDQPLRARKTSQFLTEFGVQLAVNGDFFSPWYSNSPWDYYPHVGDPVRPKGLAASRGVVYATGRPERPTLYLSRDNRASFDEPMGEVYNAISGRPMLLVAGKVVAQPGDDGYYDDLHPRTAVALDKNARRLIIVVIDGRQPNYSEGVTLAELAEILREYGGDTALNLDGGGSTTLVIEGEAGSPILLNSPIDNRIPGRERPVGNHLGIFARRIGDDGQ